MPKAAASDGHLIDQPPPVADDVTDAHQAELCRLPARASPAGRCYRGNNHSAAPAPDSGPASDSGQGAPRIALADRARCTVARPQRNARATARTLSLAARRRRVSPSRAARFSGCAGR